MAHNSAIQLKRDEINRHYFPLCTQPTNTMKIVALVHKASNNKNNEQKS